MVHELLPLCHILGSGDVNFFGLSKRQHQRGSISFFGQSSVGLSGSVYRLLRLTNDNGRTAKSEDGEEERSVLHALGFAVVPHPRVSCLRQACMDVKSFEQGFQVQTGMNATKDYSSEAGHCAIAYRTLLPAPVQRVKASW